MVAGNDHRGQLGIHGLYTLIQSNLTTRRGQLRQRNLKNWTGVYPRQLPVVQTGHETLKSVKSNLYFYITYVQRIVIVFTYI